MISYPLPDPDQITKFYKIELANLLKKKKLPVDEMVKESLGLSYADINKVCQDFFKDILVYGTEKRPPTYCLIISGAAKGHFNICRITDRDAVSSESK